MEPKFALVQLGNTTNVFIDGKYITNGVEDLIYHARNENEELCPTVEMRINIQKFSFDSDITLEQFMKNVNGKRKFLSEVAEMIRSEDTQEKG